MAIETLYPAIRPSLDLNFAGSKTLDPRITFSRASAATYYDGKTVAKAEENLLVWSQDFDSTVWPKTNASVAANVAIAPDGTNTADLLTASSDTFCGIGQGSSYPQGQTVLSIYAKAATSSIIRLGVLATGSFAWFDLTTGVAGTVQSGALATIQSVGNGWFRCVLIVTGAPQPVIRLANADNSVNATTGNSVYLWGAQLEQRAQATAYTPTTAQQITNYIPVLQTAAANVARFDHNPITGESLGLLIEEQRTNLLTYSEQLDNNSWSKVNASVAANSFVAPNGSISAYSVIISTSDGYVAKTGVTNAISGSIYTISIYTNTQDRKLVFGGATPNYLNAVYSSIPVGNGWYRHTGTVTLNSDGPVQLVLNKGSSSAGVSFAVWGAQLEAGAFPTSYIKTEASQVTRAADSASMMGANFSSWYRQDEGSILSEVAPRAIGLYSEWTICEDQFSAINRIQALAFNAYLLIVSVNGTTQAQLTGAFPVANATNKRCVTYKADDFAASLNGATAIKDTSGTVPSVGRLWIGSRGSSEVLNGTIKKISYYPKRLTDAQLQALTA